MLKRIPGLVGLAATLLACGAYPVMPMGHHATLDGASWQWETMAGLFNRRVVSDRFWWAFGLFADVGPGDDVFLPYLGGAWSPNQRWTISALLPWPALLFAPTASAGCADCGSRGAIWKTQNSGPIPHRFSPWR